MFNHPRIQAASLVMLVLIILARWNKIIWNKKLKHNLGNHANRNSTLNYGDQFVFRCDTFHIRLWCIYDVIPKIERNSMNQEYKVWSIELRVVTNCRFHQWQMKFFIVNIFEYFCKIHCMYSLLISNTNILIVSYNPNTKHTFCIYRTVEDSRWHMSQF